MHSGNKSLNSLHCCIDRKETADILFVAGRETKQQTKRDTTMTKTQAISGQILKLVSEGMDVIEALKVVCGAENVDAMISELYNELRNK